jgi:hypothetical protein
VAAVGTSLKDLKQVDSCLGCNVFLTLKLVFLLDALRRDC